MSFFDRVRRELYVPITCSTGDVFSVPRINALLSRRWCAADLDYNPVYGGW